MCIFDVVKKVFGFCKGILSEPDGTPSATRTLMYIFAFFSMWLLWRIFYHIIRITDPTLASIWLSNMPLLITTLIGLISLPYAVNKGTSTFTDIAQMVANARQMNLQGSVSDIKSAVMNKSVSTSENVSTVTTNTVVTPPAVTIGTPGQKG